MDAERDDERDRLREEWTPSGADDYDRSIHANPSAEAWADFFVETFPGLSQHRDTMLGWFANAMMAMRDPIAVERDRMREALERMEWSGHFDHCFICGGSEGDGHAKDCGLGWGLNRPECHGGGS